METLSRRAPEPLSDHSPRREALASLGLPKPVDHAGQGDTVPDFMVDGMLAFDTSETVTGSNTT